MSKILIAPQEFKGTLSARDAANAIGAGIRRACPDCDLDLLPMADGGPGTLDALVAGAGGEIHMARVHDPLMRMGKARWGVIGAGASRQAVIEMAEASGLVLVPPRERDARRATTYGTGELIAAALAYGVARMIVAVGGSATTDGGAGALQALGVRLLDRQGHDLAPGGAALASLDRIDVAGMDGRLAGAAIVIATDVTSPLCGENGAALLFGKQKGADDQAARELEEALQHFADVIRRELGVDVATTPGTGAAGGLAYGLHSVLGAAIQSGFDVVAEALGFAWRLKAADIVITGEGRLDRQSGLGKTTFGVLRGAREQGVSAVVIAGSIAGEADRSAFDAAFSVTGETTAVRANRDPARLLELAAERAGAELLRRGLLR